jgi:hypothetical protein
MGRNFIEILDKNRPFGLEAFDDVFVVNDFVPDIDGRAVFLERTFDNLDGAHDTGAKPSGLSEKNFHCGTFSQDAPCASGSPWDRNESY